MIASTQPCAILFPSQGTLHLSSSVHVLFFLLSSSNAYSGTSEAQCCTRAVRREKLMTALSAMGFSVPGSSWQEPHVTPRPIS